jgi:hypothetical protein
VKIVADACIWRKRFCRRDDDPMRNAEDNLCFGNQSFYSSLLLKKEKNKIMIHSSHFFVNLKISL